MKKLVAIIDKNKGFKISSKRKQKLSVKFVKDKLLKQTIFNQDFFTQQRIFQWFKLI